MSLEQLGPYAIGRTLGRGGMGAVYEGVHTETGERVAIKVLSPAYMDEPTFRSRFQSEVDALVTLDHDHIVRLLGHGEQEGRLFYTMELVDGPTLQDRINRGHRFDWDETIQTALQVASALNHAHAHGVIHRDLKPANLIVAPDGIVKLADFGIAKVFGADGHTVVGGVIGTAEFMAPEQARGLPVTARSDLFSLGSVLYTMLAGKPPFEGASRTALLKRLIRQDPPPLLAAAPQTPPQLVDLIERLMRRNPDGRIPSASSLIKQLKALQHGLRANPPGVTPQEEPDADADDFELDQSDKTRVPTPAQARGSSHYWRETVVADADAATVVGPRSTHYTTVDPESDPLKERSSKQRKAPDGEGLNAWLNTVGLVGMLLIAIGFIWYASRPPSANKLYAQIVVVANADDETKLSSIDDKMSEFLELYPEDQRASTVVAWMQDLECHRLWRRLERRARQRGGAEFLPRFEGRYITASRQAQLDTAAAADAFKALAQDLSSEGAATEEQLEILEAARHRASRYSAALEP